MTNLSKIINSQLHIKVEQYIEEELEAVLKKAAASMKYHLKYERKQYFVTYKFDYATPCCNKAQ